MTDADVLVVGGGIAGWCAAWSAARRGRSVTVVDEGVHRASDLPAALVNPLRGRHGRLVARGVDGMHATFALIDALRADGHPIVVERGLYRPLIDRHDDGATEAYWRAAIGSRLAFDWHPRAPAVLGLAEPVPALLLRDAGWLEPAGLLAALAAASRATRVDARVDRVGPDHALLADGRTIRARDVVWCGGAWGAALLDDDGAAAAGRLAGDIPHAAADDGRYEPGSLLRADTSPTGAAATFGTYAVPRDGGMLVGPTRESPRARFADDALSDDVVRQLEDRVARVFGSTIALRPAWRGVRLARLSTSATRALRGVATLTAFGSRGCLMAPLLAADWARSL